MTERKKSGKKSKETGTWYKSLIQGKNKAEYYRHFIKKLNDITTEYFGAQEAHRVLKAVETHKISVPAIETFLFDFNDISDPALQLFNTCTSIEEFITKSIISYKKRAETGETSIVMKDLFFVLSDMLSSEEINNVNIKELLRNFIMSLITTTEESPYIMSLVHPKWAPKLGEILGLNTAKYQQVSVALIETFKEINDNTEGIKAYLPKLQIIYPVYYDVRENQINYLTSHFGLVDRPTSVKKILEEIPDLSQDTPQLRSALEYLCYYAKTPFFNIDAIILELQELGDSPSLKRYTTRNSLTKIYTAKKLFHDYYNKSGIQPVFVNQETFESCLRPYFSDVQIDCSHIRKENLESFIDIAKTINLVKGYYTKTKRDMDTLTFKITLLNVKEVTEDFMEFIRNKLLRIKSLTNKNFIIEVYYDKDTVNQRIPEDLITHFRVISDIHADINRECGYNFNFGNDFILNCGDTSGDANTTGYWIRNYMRRGALVIGNHFGYSSSHPERDGIQNMEKYSNTKHPSNTKREQMKQLFNILDNQSTSLLSNTCIEYKGIIIIGTCLYTDFDLYGKEHREECMNFAKQHMNDFRLPVVMDNQYYTQDKHGYWWPNSRKISESCIRPFAPSDHAFYFQYSFGFIKQKVEEYKHKPIIIMTHHAPSPYSIGERYKGSLLNAAFASNLNQYIVEHPQIRLWTHGHIHTPSDYILGETRIVCCPFGYGNENNFHLPYEYGLRIPITDIKSKKSWRTILCKEIGTGKIMVYDE